MTTLHYSKAHRLNVLHDQLLAAGITPERVEGLGSDIWITVADDGQPSAAIDAVVAAHSATAPTPAEADETTRRTAVQNAVQALVGVRWQDMTAAQKQTLIVALLYRAGAIDKNLAVRPLADWL